jgi:hypothetical protein
MQNHQARAPRFDLDLPIRFFSTDGMIVGRCVNISESGIRGTFDSPVDVWLEGDLSFQVDGQYLGIRARVVRADGRDAGLWFRINSETDKSIIAKLLAMAEQQSSNE